MGGRPLADCREVSESRVLRVTEHAGERPSHDSGTLSLLLRQLAENVAKGDGDDADEKKEEKRPEQETMGLFRCGRGQGGFPFGGATLVFGDLRTGCRRNPLWTKMFESVDDGCPILDSLIRILCKHLRNKIRIRLRNIWIALR